jgi:hypothetical protein
MTALRSLRSLVLVSALALAGGVGCFLDEIDKSMELYPGHKKTAKPEPKADAPGKGNDGAPQSAAAWWATARSIGPELHDDTITSCTLGGRNEFMRRDNCLARGGTPE